ncbi:MAG: T9SS type A sorting domain-containing protein [Bacteroidales bacterium]|nr:T9SS type A sorting domain-containing protein [Bacteroidales bacterium]
MRKYILTSLLVSLAVGLIAQQLSFRFANPRIIRVSGFDNIEYDVQIKCSVAGTYYFSGSYIFVFNNNALSQNATQWTVTKAPLVSGNNSADNPKYTVTKTITGVAPNKKFNVALTCDAGIISNGPNSDDFSEIPTDWTTIFTVRGRITSAGFDAGIDFYEPSMNGQQSYSIAVSPYWANYQNPNQFDSKDLLTTALGRIYSTAYGWSQVGNSVNAQWVDWNTAVNTTVWEGSAQITQSDNTAALFNNLNLLNGATLHIDANKWVTVQGNLTNTGSASNLMVHSGGSLITQGSVTGEGTLESATATSAWKLISPPVPGLTANIFLNQYLQQYNEATNSWSDITDPTTSLAVGKGYAAWAPPVSYTGTFNTGDYNVNVTKNGLGYNLVGNAYPSGLDITNPSLWNINLGAAKYVWNQGFGNYQTTVNTIPPAQGFFVLASNAATITIPNSARVHTSTPLIKAGEANELKLYIEGNGYADEAFVKVVEGSTNGFDYAYDVPKMFGLLDAPQLYTVIPQGEFTQLTQNTYPDIASNDVVPLNLKVGAENSYTLSAEGISSFVEPVKVTLVDLKTGTSQLLNNNPVYTFTAQPNDDPGRFLLLFSTATGIELPALEGLNIYAWNRNIMVNNTQNLQGDIVVYDLVGKELMRTQAKPGLNQLPVNYAASWYLVKFISSQGSVSQKVFIR